MSSKLELLTGRNYLSYSSMSSYLECGKRYELERIYNAPQSPAWYFLGGDAVHSATEALDKGEQESVEQAWTDAWMNALDTLEPGEEPRAGGRKSAAWPNKEDRAWWEHHGPGMVAEWVRWRDASGYQFLEMPDGSPAIEVPVDFEFASTMVKGYIDRVMVDGSGQVIVVDLKTGSRKPVSSLQLAVYALGLQHVHGITATLGGYWMSRQGDIPSLHSLAHLTSELVGGWFNDVHRGIEQEIFVPKVSPLCSACSVKDFCPAVGGNESALTRPIFTSVTLVPEGNMSDNTTSTQLTSEDPL